MYPIETKIVSKNGWSYPSEVRGIWGVNYARTGITIHWWGGGEPASKHDSIVNAFINWAKSGTKSVNYVLSDNKITMLVHPDNVAWCSNSGNPTTISIEHQPTLHAEGYKKSGWLVWQLEKRYNRKLTLYPHKHWVSTACPGTIDLNRIRSEANKWASGGYNPKPAPKPVLPPSKPNLTWTKLAKVTTYTTNKQPTNLWDFNAINWNMKSVKQFKKGEKIDIYGTCYNQTLKATYLVTEYSFSKKITNGFNQADLDKYIPPVVVKPTPTPPPVQVEPPKPANPAPEVPSSESDYERRLTALEVLVDKIVGFLQSIFSGFKR